MAANCHGVHHATDVYLADLQRLLDEYSSGRTSRSEAVRRHSDLCRRFAVLLTRAFVDRLLNLGAAHALARTVAGEPIEEYPIPYVHRAHTPDAPQDPAASSASAPPCTGCAVHCPPEGE